MWYLCFHPTWFVRQRSDFLTNYRETTCFTDRHHFMDRPDCEVHLILQG